MNQQIKLLVIILGLLAALGLGGAFMFYQDNQKNVRKFTAVERNLKQSIAALQEENSAFRLNEQRLIDEQKAMEEQRAIAQRDLEQVKRELGRAKDEVSYLSSQVDTLKTERDALTEQLDELAARREESDRQLEQLRRSKSALERTAADLKKQLARLQTDYDQFKTTQQVAAATPPRPSSIPQLTASIGDAGPTSVTVVTPPASSGAVTLPPIIVQPPVGGVPAALSQIAQRHAATGGAIRLVGHVVSVNPEHQFVVIDRGANDGVSVGDRFQVSRQLRPLGVITVIRVRESIAACDAKALPPQVRPRVGDTVNWQPPALSE